MCGEKIIILLTLVVIQVAIYLIEKILFMLVIALYYNSLNLFYITDDRILDINNEMSGYKIGNKVGDKVSEIPGAKQMITWMIKLMKYLV